MLRGLRGNMTVCSRTSRLKLEDASRSMVNKHDHFTPAFHRHFDIDAAPTGLMLCSGSAITMKGTDLTKADTEAQTVVTGISSDEGHYRSMLFWIMLDHEGHIARGIRAEPSDVAFGEKSTQLSQELHSNISKTKRLWALY